MGGLISNWVTQQVPLIGPFIFASFYWHLVPPELSMVLNFTAFLPLSIAAMSSPWLGDRVSALAVMWINLMPGHPSVLPSG